MKITLAIEDIKLIEKEIESLPTKMRKTFLLSRKENLTYAEVARELDLSKDTVRSHAKHALKILLLKLGLLSFLFIFF